MSLVLDVKRHPLVLAAVLAVAELRQWGDSLGGDRFEPAKPEAAGD